jgi:hypothetical protein
MIEALSTPNTSVSVPMTALGGGYSRLLSLIDNCLLIVVIPEYISFFSINISKSTSSSGTCQLSDRQNYSTYSRLRRRRPELESRFQTSTSGASTISPSSDTWTPCPDSRGERSSYISCTSDPASCALKPNTALNTHATTNNRKGNRRFPRQFISL